MSNQVYANNSVKYYPQTGYDGWGLASDVTTASLVAITLKPSEHIVTISPVSYITVNATTGVIEFQASGMYQLSLIAETSSTNAMTIRLTMDVDGVGSIAAVRQLFGVVADGHLRIPLNYTGYFEKGNQLTIGLLQQSTGNITVYEDGTVLFVTKLS